MGEVNQTVICFMKNTRIFFVWLLNLLISSNQLLKQKLPGMYVMPSAKYRFLWNGVLFLREKLYAGGALRFTMTIPDNYPDGDCPVSYHISGGKFSWAYCQTRKVE